MLKTNFLQMELYNLFVSKMTVKQGKSLLDQGRSKSRISKGQAPVQQAGLQERVQDLADGCYLQNLQQRSRVCTLSRKVLSWVGTAPEGFNIRGSDNFQ